VEGGGATTAVVVGVVLVWFFGGLSILLSSAVTLVNPMTSASTDAIGTRTARRPSVWRRERRAARVVPIPFAYGSPTASAGAVSWSSLRSAIGRGCVASSVGVDPRAMTWGTATVPAFRTARLA
jgi:short subunit dehydrogenase-like uncharacterized protein